MPKSRKILTRNKDFAKRAERFENLKGIIKKLEDLLEGLKIRKEMLDRYGKRSITIPVFKSPRGLRVMMKVDRTPITNGQVLRNALGIHFRYPLVKKKDEFELNLKVLRRLIRQGKLPKEVEELVTALRVAVNTYVPKPSKGRSSRKKE